MDYRWLVGGWAPLSLDPDEVDDGWSEGSRLAVTKPRWKWTMEDDDGERFGKNWEPKWWGGVMMKRGWGWGGVVEDRPMAVSRSRRVEMRHRWLLEMGLHLDAPKIHHWECRRTGTAGSPSVSLGWGGWHGGRGWWSTEGGDQSSGQVVAGLV